MYTATITDSIGCSITVSVPISNPGGPSSLTKTFTNVTCNGSCNGAVTALTPVGGVPPYTFLWLFNGQTTDTISNLCPGVYFVQVADSNGCTLVDSVTISPQSPIVTNQVVSPASCGACDGNISLAPSGGSGNYSYSWLPGLQITSSITNQCAGVYTVQITDITSGCVQTVAIPLNGQNGPLLTTTSTPVLCSDSCNGTASVTAVGGILPYTYLWSSGSTPANDTTAGLCSGSYFVQVTDSAGCVSIAPVVITQPPPIGFSFANSIDPLCNGSNNGSITVTPFGGVLPYTFSWTSSASTTNTATNLTSGPYTVTLTDANGCSSSQTITLTDPVAQTISHIATNPSCNTVADGVIDVTNGGGTPGYTYQWSGGSSATTQDLTTLLIGSYTLTVTDTNGCTIKDTIVLTSALSVFADAGRDTAYCGSNLLLLSAAGSSANVVNYHWFQIPSATAIGNTMNLSYTPLAGVTNYYVVVDNGAGCSDSDTITVTVNTVSANAGADVSIISGGSATIGGSPTGPAGSTYQWNPLPGLDNGTGSNPVANPNTTTTYTVTVTSPQGCIGTDEVIVKVEANIVFGNGISPNGDGANDDWIIENIEEFPNCVVEVYNRWGELLFQSVGYKEKWAGLYKGQLLPVGTYYYIINLNDPLFPDASTGPITILR